MAENLFDNELIEKAKGAKSAEELLAMAKEKGVELTKEQAEEYFARLNPVSGEMSDDELDAVAGGGCGSSKPEDPANFIGKYVRDITPGWSCCSICMRKYDTPYNCYLVVGYDTVFERYVMKCIGCDVEHEARAENIELSTL